MRLRTKLRHLLLERLPDAIRQHHIRRLRICHHLHHVIARQLLGEVLIETLSHGQNVNIMQGGGLARSPDERHQGDQRKRKSFH